MFALLDRFDRAGPVDMTLDEVAAEAVADAQRQLEVHSVARLQPAERSDVERLLHHVGLEAVAVDRDRGQADAVHRNRIALRELTGEWGPDGDARACFLDLAGLGDQPGEHHHSLSRAVTSTSSSIRSTVV